MGAIYDEWLEAFGIPIYKGYYIEDLRTLELGWWEERECKSAFIQLAGQENIGETRVIEIPPGKTLPPWKFALDEVVYVIEGRGLTNVWDESQKVQRSFEWQKHSLFLIPHHFWRQLSNVQGDRPTRLLHYNYLPLAMQAVEDPIYFFNNPYNPASDTLNEFDEFYSEAKAIMGKLRKGLLEWYGNFFPSMSVWDKLAPLKGRGAGGHVVMIQFPNSTMSAHMSIFPTRTYKKAHRHGPGYFIVIPSGEGYSVMWEEGKEKITIPWHEASVFVPPSRWFHQHFNVDAVPVRYLALHPNRPIARLARSADRARDQIEYPDEDPWIKEKFEDELRKKDLTSLMPEEAFKDRNFEWNYSEE